ncbi:MAG TPA: biotin/lipoyl-containing protein [Caldimonas sp.]|jgi:3-methylcrotonyl-CoA carboxylase alpha subunit
MAHAFRLDEHDHEVWLSRSHTGYRVHIGDTCIAAAMTAKGEHVRDLTIEGRDERVRVALIGDDVHVHLDGESYLLRYSHGLERFAGEALDADEAIARAPMPGSVIAVSVEVGATVRRGQTLLVIESMKMETSVVAPCDGVVQALHVALGRTFERDALLVTIERSRTPT